MGSIYAHRGGLQACATGNGRRKKKNFRTGEEKKATRWITQTEARMYKPGSPHLGGPGRVTLGGMLRRYAELYTVGKKSWKSELDRINRYLAPCDLRPLRGTKKDDGTFRLEEVPLSPGATVEAGRQRGFARHAEDRRHKRATTNELRTKLARTVVADIDKAQVRAFIATMTSDALSGSTVRLEMALLKHAFNMAIKEWGWDDFQNPVVGLKLPKAAPPRDVTLTTADERRLREELGRADSPYLLPYLDLAIETTARRGSLLALEWRRVDLERRELVLYGTKGGHNVTVPLTLRAVEVLRRLPRHGDDPRVFPLTADALDGAWGRACERAGLTGIRKHDMRSVGSTRHAKRLRSTTMLMQVTGHRTLSMVQRYVRFMTGDLLEALDATENTVPTMPLPPDLASLSADKVHAQRRAAHCNGAAGAPNGEAGPDEAAAPTESVKPGPTSGTAGNVFSFDDARKRRRVA